MSGPMPGPLVPVMLLPRFTSYVGPGTYATVPLPVEEFVGGHVTFWRGPLVGGAVSTPFEAVFEESHDAFVWTAAGSTITTVDRSDIIGMMFLKRWFRVRVVLTANAGGIAAISLWLNGVFVRRTP